MPHSEGWMVLLEKDQSEDSPQCDANTTAGGAGTTRATSQASGPPQAQVRLPPLQSQAPSLMMSPEHCLAEVDNLITFKLRDNAEYFGRIHIKNIAPACAIIFKVKTTSPDRYRVRPTIAVVEPGSTAKVPITSQAGLTPAQIQEDRFQVQVCLLPKNMLRGDKCESIDSSNENNDSALNSSFAELNSIFKRLINQPGTLIDTFKLEVYVVPQKETPAKVECGECKIPNNMENNIADAVFKKLRPVMEHILMMLYMILLALICLIVLMIAQWFRNQEVEADCDKGCPDYVHKSKCIGCYGSNSDGWL